MKHLSTKIIFLTTSLLLINLSNMNAQTNTQNSTPAQLVDALHSAFGDNHSRAVHAKGIIMEGEFTPDPKAAKICKAFHLQKANSQVIIRFSNFTGIPNIPDNVPPANPRGLAIKFKMADGSTTDIVAHSFNGFPTENSDQFRQLLLAIAASGSGATKPTALDSFLNTHPVAKTFLTTQKNPASYAAVKYFGVNAFKFTNSKGETHFIRYQFIPLEAEELLTAEEFAAAGPEYLQTEIKDRIAKHSIKYKLFAQIAGAGDKIDNPSVAWPDSRTTILLGIIEIKNLSVNDTNEDKVLSFSPNNIPAGIETADPMLDFRSKAYPISVKGRQ